MVGTGIATGAGTRVDVTLKVSQLQNLCKRDPEGYREDYDAQVRRLESECGILAWSPLSDPSPRLVELIHFAAAVSSSSYKGAESDRIAQLLKDLLLGQKTAASGSTSTSTTATRASAGPPEAAPSREDQQQSVANVTSMSTWALQLHRDVRKACVSALILMRNKGAVAPLQILELFFRVMAVVPDKSLREQLYHHIVNDIRNINKKGKRDEKVNRSIQTFLHRVVSTHGQAGNHNNSSNHDGSVSEAATDVAAKRATDMVCELYRRNVWTDENTVAILTSAVQCQNTTVMCRAIRFFLNIEEQMARIAKEEEEEDWMEKNQVDFHLHSRKKKSRLRHVQRQVKNRAKHQKKREGMNGIEWLEEIAEDKGAQAGKKLYPAIELIHDPQGLAESVFQRVRSAGKAYKFETKLLMINLITRLVGNHELILLPLYPFLQKFMGGHQRDVTAILAHSVQACHEYVPPEEIYGLLKTIAHNFITERCSEEQIAVGINAARAICARVPTVMSLEEAKESSGSTVMDIEAFARDLTGFSNHRDRSVAIAGKAWTNFVREVNPGLLQGKNRGLKGSALHKNGEKPRRFGDNKVSVGVEGADLLVEYESQKAAHLKRKRMEEDDDGDEADEDGDNVEEEEGEEVEEEALEEVEDSDDEAPDLMVLDPTDATNSAKSEDDEGKDVIDLSKMTPEERAKLRSEVSASRVFTSADFAKMRQLLDREYRAKRDPREAARRKRALAKGAGFEELSGDEQPNDDSDEEDNINVQGVVHADAIMATAAKKRKSKAERLGKVLAGREKFESKTRTGGSTNIEKTRKKNFVMAKYSYEARKKGKGKGSRQEKKNGKSVNSNHENKKRRRK